MKFETINSKELANTAVSELTKGKPFAYDHIHQQEVILLKKDRDSRVNIRINLQRSSLKAILLICQEPYTAGTRDTEKFPFIGWKKLNITIKGSPSKIFSKGLKAKDFWEVARRYFNPLGGAANAQHEPPKVLHIGQVRAAH